VSPGCGRRGSGAERRTYLACRPNRVYWSCSLPLADGALQVADLTSEIACIDGAPAAVERLRDANTMKIRKCLDPILILSEGHLRTVLAEFARH
jgi:hypothetical protein